MRATLLWIYEGEVPLEYQTVPLHVPRQPSYQVAWLVREGVATYELGGRVWKAGAGLWMFPMGKGLAKFSKDARILSIRFQLEWPSQMPVIALQKPLVVAAAQIPELEREGCCLLEEARLQHGVADVRFREQLVSLEGYLRLRLALDRWLLAYAGALHKLGCPLGVMEETEARIGMACRMVQEHPLDQPFREVDLATQLGMSIRNLTYLYIRSFGCTPHADYEMRRFSRACTLLAESDRPAKDIAYSLGFSSPSHFTKWFRRRCGFQPIEYRRQWNGEQK